MSDAAQSNLGPLAGLVGSWEGIYGEDTEGKHETSFRETITFEPIGPIASGNRQLHGLRSSRFNWVYQQSDDVPTYEDLGFWFWCPEENRVIHSFTTHFGVTVNASGSSQAAADSFTISAEAGADDFGITSVPQLNEGERTLGYRITWRIKDETSIGYEQEIRTRSEDNDETHTHHQENELAKVY